MYGMRRERGSKLPESGFSGHLDFEKSFRGKFSQGCQAKIICDMRTPYCPFKKLVGLRFGK